MNQQPLNGEKLCQKLMLEEFRYWNYSRANTSGDSIQDIKKRLDEIRNAIRNSLTNR